MSRLDVPGELNDLGPEADFIMFQNITACVCDQIASLSYLIDKVIIAPENTQDLAN